ncbi:tetratricopeptide repeat protein, partial [bacterium]|nr:tetratricopeptide repeat protein [bacterium]
MDSNIEKIELIKKSFEYKLKGQYTDALSLLYRALEFDQYDADNVELLSQIAQLHYLLGNVKRSLEQYERALQINPHHTFSLQECYKIYDKEKNYREILKIAKKMFDFQKTPDSCFYYIDALIKNHDIQGALDTFDTFEDEFKREPDILYLISEISPSIKREVILKRIIDLDSSHRKANLALAKMSFENEKYDECIKYCLNISEDDAFAYYYIGLAEYKKHNYKSAIDNILKAINLDCDENDFYFELAKVYIDALEFENALFALKKSINHLLNKNKKENLDERYFLSGWIFLKLKQKSKALLNLGSIEATSKFYLNAKILMQTANLESLNISSAMKTLEEYYKTDCNNPFLVDALELIYKELKMYKNALLMCDRALELNPNSIYYMLEKIDLLIDANRLDEALSLVNQFNLIYKTCAQSYNSLTRIRYRLKDYNSALMSINKAISLDNQKPEYYYFQGLILNDIDNYSLAKTSLYNAIKYDPMCAKYYAQMAKSYLGLHELESALLYAKEAIEMDADEINYKKLA